LYCRPKTALLAMMLSIAPGLCNTRASSAQRRCWCRHCSAGGAGAAAPFGDGSSSEPVAKSSASGTYARGNSRALLEWLTLLALAWPLAAEW
ncbi:hypothetical protein COO60DRAFT_1495752, partial [Scenedesmus sp. NREL 46B-D3]